MIMIIIYIQMYADRNEAALLKTPEHQCQAHPHTVDLSLSLSLSRSLSLSLSLPLSRKLEGTTLSGKSR